MTKKRTPAPRHLSNEAKRFWRIVIADYALEHHHERLLQTACEAWDRTQEARQCIADEGLLIDGRYGKRQNPAVTIEKQSRESFMRALRDLDLDAETRMYLG